MIDIIIKAWRSELRLLHKKYRYMPNWIGTFP